MSAESEIRHEIVSRNPDIEVRFYLSEDPGSYVTPHWHNSLELVYMIEGSMIIRYDNSRIQTLPAGEFSVVNPRVIHSVTAFQNRALVLQIPDTVLEKYIPEHHLIEFYVNMHPDTPVEITKLERLKKIFMDMYIVYDIRPDAYLLKFNSLLYDLLYTLVHSYSVKIPVKDMEKRKKSIGKVKEIMVYIEKNHSVKLTVEDIAEKFGYNPDYISRLFKKHIGLTMIQYLYEIRLSGIIRDLQETELHIHEIFERHGCTNYKYAMQLFKSRFGCTPKEKQKEFRKQNNI
ncbi:MAG: helix-turn-helix domain-containing protein [Ruminococcus sp.]